MARRTVVAQCVYNYLGGVVMKLLTGKAAFLWQNLSAAYLALFVPYLLWLSFKHSISSLNELTATLTLASVFIPSIIAIALLTVHIWVGLRDIIIDYIPRTWLHLSLLTLVILLILLIANLAWLALKVFSL